MITPKILKAITVAAKAHDHQYRKGSTLPYISHPYSVMLFAAEATKNEDVLIAALLHDVLEDAPHIYSEKDMRRDFGDTVTNIVLDVTEDGDPNDKATWKERKKKYIAHLLVADESALIVSLADKTHNLATTIEDYEQLGEQLWERFNAGKEQQLWFYTSVAEVLDKRLGDHITHRYNTLVRQLQGIIN